MPQAKQYQNLVTELRRGSLTLAVLGCLRRPHYGYALLQTLRGKGVAIEANTLYPLLRRLEGQGLLGSDWDTSESRPRKYYSLSDSGGQVFENLLAEWRRLQQSIESICTEEEENSKPD